MLEIPISERKKAEIRKQTKAAIEMMDETLASLKAKLKGGKPLNHQELQSLRFIIKERPKMEYAIVETKEEKIEEGKLRDYVESLWSLTELIYGEDTKSKLTRELWDKIADDMGYYRCSKCGELHEKDRECMFVEYKEHNRDNEHNEDNEVVEEEEQGGGAVC